ncbi:hypothetical protein SCLCIDRAFT_1223984 [Scleroderma citrinum Foug A]|uniref:Uncharacterized protein n=1 Tax=Scleroderma citrinum Foug A TaxID=1036808 RepID=A0A0C3D6Z3_9AGAM|nr:hypothetical protein SCLCIDRAFT_1223984 [Scleroderma citrinum Foug A]
MKNPYTKYGGAQIPAKPIRDVLLYTAMPKKRNSFRGNPYQTLRAKAGNRTLASKKRCGMLTRLVHVVFCSFQLDCK